MYELGVIGTKHVPEELMLNDLSGMFEMGTGRIFKDINLDRVHFYLFRSANSKPTE
jgi:hypothetical protein